MCCGDTGVIIPSGSQAPDSSILSVESMDVHVVIENGHATVSLKEVFRNHKPVSLEGTYSLALPGDAAVSDFAVWDDLTRIPGVILERKRANELYEQARNQVIDPGLLESGEVTESTAPGEAKRSTEFTVKIVPIPAYGYKRIETEYRQSVPVSQLASDFVFPLKPTSGTAVVVAHFSVSTEVRSAQAITNFQNVSSAYPLKLSKQTPQLIAGSFSGQDIELTRDFEVKYSLSNDAAPHVTPYRTGVRSEPGYFEASSILQPPKVVNESATTASRTVIVLFDTSLSMQWDKLERSFQALEGVLRSLKPTDAFNVLVFNSDTVASAPQPKPATTDAVARALEFVRGSKLRGGTNIESAFQAAFKEAGQDSYIVLLSDGDMTEGTVAPAKVAEWMDQTWKAIAANRRPHVYALAIGDDANVRFMQRLTEHGGAFEQVNSTEPLDFKLASFVHKIGLAPLSQVALTISPQANTKFVYRAQQDNFPGTRASWVGEYMKPGVAEFTVQLRVGRDDGWQIGSRRFASREYRTSLPSRNVGARPSGRAARKNRSRRRGQGHDRRDHSTVSQVSLCDALHIFSRCTALFASAPAHSPGRSRAARSYGPLDYVRDCTVSVWAYEAVALFGPRGHLANTVPRAG